MFLAYVPRLIAATGMDFRKPYSQCQVGYIFLFVKNEEFWELDLGSKRISYISPEVWVSSQVGSFYLSFIQFSVETESAVARKNEAKSSLGDFMHIW